MNRLDPVGQTVVHARRQCLDRTKNKAYWRYGEELESLRRSLDAGGAREGLAQTRPSLLVLSTTVELNRSAGRFLAAKPSDNFRESLHRGRD